MPSPAVLRPFVFGLSHHSATVSVRDSVFVDEASAPDFLRRLRGSGIEQAVLLSTCDRVEVQGVHADPDTAADRVAGLLAEIAGISAGEVAGQGYRLADDEAVRQILMVASSLDSATIGEPQVLGQIKAAVRLSQRESLLGPELDSVLQWAFRVAKRVRNQTDIGRRPVSIAAASVQIARELHGDLGRRSALLIGLGDMGELIANQLKVAGLNRIALTGHARRTEAEALRRGCHFVAHSDLADALAGADIVITAIGAGRVELNRRQLDQALRARRQRPMLVIDASVPTDVDPAADRLDDVFLYTLDDLERVATEGRMGREASAASALAIIDEAVADWCRDGRERGAVPQLSALREAFEAERAAVLREKPDANAEEATRRLINRLLHQPSLALRQLAADDATDEGIDAASLGRCLRLLFTDRRSGGQD